MFIRSCTFTVLYYRLRSANPEQNQIISVAPRRKPTLTRRGATVNKKTPPDNVIRNADCGDHEQQQQEVGLMEKENKSKTSSCIVVRGEERQKSSARRTRTQCPHSRDADPVSCHRPRVSISDATAEKRG